MKKTFFASLYAVVFGLVLSTAWILATPVPAYAATCTAQCGNNKTVTCTASGSDTCLAMDDIGCAVLKPNGDQRSGKTCSEVAIEESEN